GSERVTGEGCRGGGGQRVRGLGPEARKPRTQAGDSGDDRVCAPPADASRSQEAAGRPAHGPPRRRESHHGRCEEPQAQRSVSGGCSPVNRSIRRRRGRGGPWIKGGHRRRRMGGVFLWRALAGRTPSGADRLYCPTLVAAIASSDAHRRSIAHDVTPPDTAWHAKSQPRTL